MADAFEVSQPTVWRWLNQSKQLPAEHVLHAERDTGVSRHWLRPDIYPLDHPAAPGAPNSAAIALPSLPGAVTREIRPVSKRHTPKRSVA